MKKIMFGVIGLLALVVVLILFNPGFTAFYANMHPQMDQEVVVEEKIETVIEEQVDSTVIDIIDIEEPQEEPVTEPIAEEPKAEEPVVEEPMVEEPIVEEPKAEEPVVEEPMVEEPIAEEPMAEEPVEEPAIDITMEPIEEIQEEMVTEPEPDLEEIIVEIPEDEEPSGDIFFGEYVAPAVTEPVSGVKYVYEMPEYSNKGFFFQTGMFLEGGMNNYEGNTSIVYGSGFEMKFGGFFTEKLGAYVFAKPEFLAEIRNITTFIGLPNSVNVSAGAGFAFDFGKFGVQAQAGYSVLNLRLIDENPYMFGTFSLIPEFSFVQQGKIKVKLTMPLTVNISGTGYDAFGGLGLSVKMGGKQK